jgi:hypothetical protein
LTFSLPLIEDTLLLYYVGVSGCLDLCSMVTIFESTKSLANQPQNTNIKQK